MVKESRNKMVKKTTAIKKPEDYDIDRIVIPEGWKENAKIEVIKHAEIETPTWKENKNNVKNPSGFSGNPTLTLEAPSETVGGRGAPPLDGQQP